MFTGDTNKVQRKSIALSRVLIIGSKPAQALVGGLSMVHSVKCPQQCLRKQLGNELIGQTTEFFYLWNSDKAFLQYDQLTSHIEFRIRCSHDQMTPMLFI